MGSETLSALIQQISDPNAGDNSHSIGLKNVHERIRMRFGNSYGLTINSYEKTGTEIKIKVPQI